MNIYLHNQMQSILLNDAEVYVFDLLLKVVESKTPTTILRLAGGAVRDKLLAIETNDLDIAVSNMSGLEFANLVIDYQKARGLNFKTPTIIKANPDQSKHLETAMLEINGLSIDFVNLRKETYADSRIPIVEIGTIEEDAQRRDLTINALYYNLHTKEIEDYVGGLEDLNNCIARTPIDPIQTFIDDPLRIYRCVRFATKYNLKIDKEIYWATKNSKVIDALKTKVSHERIGKEIFGYLLADSTWKNGCFSESSANAAEALEILEKMDLLHIVFPECNINFHKAYYDLINANYNSDSQNTLVSVLAVILQDELAPFSSEALLSMKCPKNIVSRVIKLISGVESLKYNWDNDKELRRFLKDIKDDWVIAASIIEAKYVGNEDFDDQRIWDKLYGLINEQGGLEALSPIKGVDLIEEEFSPGKNIGLALAAVDEELLNNPKLTFEEAFEICLPFKDQSN